MAVLRPQSYTLTVNFPSVTYFSVKDLLGFIFDLMLSLFHIGPSLAALWTEKRWQNAVAATRSVVSSGAGTKGFN